MENVSNALHLGRPETMQNSAQSQRAPSDKLSNEMVRARNVDPTPSQARIALQLPETRKSPSAKPQIVARTKE